MRTSFREAFEPLAHHFYPDGCPTLDLDGSWPTRTTRTPIPPQQAVAAIPSIPVPRQWVEVEALCLVALATLPINKGTTSDEKTIKSVGIGSPLVDGTSRYFRDLLHRAIIQNGSEATTTTSEATFRRVMDRLLSQQSRMDAAARCVLLQWCTLQPHDHSLRRYEAIWMAWARTPETCADAVRLLLRDNQRLQAYRIRQFQICWKKAKSDPKRAKLLRPLRILLQASEPSAECRSDDFASLTDRSWMDKFAIQDSRPTKRARLEGLTSSFVVAPFEDHVILASMQDLWPNRHTLLLQDDFDGSNDTVRQNLPHILSAEWYEGNQTKQHVLDAFAKWVRCSGGNLMWPELERFLLHHIVPIYADHLPVLTELIPTTTTQIGVGGMRSLILHRLEPIFHLGRDPRLQYHIVASALAGLVYHWGRCCENQPAVVKQIQKLVGWTDELLMKGFLLDSPNEDVLSAATFDFYMAVTRTSATNFFGAPSAALLYRMLLSSSSFATERLCQLMDAFKGVFERLSQGGIAVDEGFESCRRTFESCFTDTKFLLSNDSAAWTKPSLLLSELFLRNETVAKLQKVREKTKQSLNTTGRGCMTLNQDILCSRDD